MPDTLKNCRKAPSARFLEAQNAREKLRERLHEEGANDLSVRLAKCGIPMRLVCTACGATTAGETRCKRKWCPVCVRKIAAERVARFDLKIEAMQWPLLVTWTTKNYETLSPDPVRAMFRAFGKIRKQRWFRSKVKGGVAALEVTDRGRGLHPHLHSVIDCKWFSVTTQAPAFRADSRTVRARYVRSAKEIGDQFALAMDRPSSVDIARVSAKKSKSGKGVAFEVLKYAVKSSDLLECEGEIAPIIRLLDGSRLIRSWGNCYGAGSIKEVRESPQCGCENCGKIGSLMPEEFANSGPKSTQPTMSRAELLAHYSANDLSRPFYTRPGYQPPS